MTYLTATALDVSILTSYFLAQQCLLEAQDSEKESKTRLVVDIDNNNGVLSKVEPSSSQWNFLYASPALMEILQTYQEVKL
jgi:hypothetical protein